MKLATWNVNSIRVRLPHVLDWLQARRPDVLCLQETKVEDHAFPVNALREMGYDVCTNGQKTYNGVATLSLKPVKHVVTTLPGSRDEQKRFLAVDIGKMHIVNVYVPNGAEVGCEKFRYKLSWLRRLTEYLAEAMTRYNRVIVMGDYNIAPADEDVYNPKGWEGSVLVSPLERKAFQGLIDLGLIDIFREFEQPDARYSWWDYRHAAFTRNWGLRIDHILCSAVLARKCTSSDIDTAPRGWQRPSDHAPVFAEFKQ